MDEVRKNLNAVKSEAKEMLRTMTAIKGEKYTETVRVLLLVKQVADITSLLCDAAGESNPDMASACAMALSQSLTTIAMTQRIVGAVEEDEWTAMLRDTDALIGNVSSLMKTAVDAGRTGQSFGGTD